MSADPNQDPSPAVLAEREREDKERKIREDAEQAQLPYKWTQTIRDVDVTAPIPGNLKGRDLDVVLTKNKIRIAIKGQEPLIEVCQALRIFLSPDDAILSHLHIKANQFISVLRVIFPTLSWLTNPPGPWRPPPPHPERKSTSTSTR
jgi:hypothetical protein